MSIFLAVSLEDRTQLVCASQYWPMGRPGQASPIPWAAQARIPSLKMSRQVRFNPSHRLDAPECLQLQGIIPRAIRQFFREAAEHAQRRGQHARLSVTFLEIYNEEIRDLLDPPAPGAGRTAKAIVLREGQGGTIQVAAAAAEVAGRCELRAERDRRRPAAAGGRRERGGGGELRGDAALPGTRHGGH